ncbi:hypothetical protein HD554DRAFT_235332 [Boletus coccyginus]|nr:hypothetical protein HD554DRAFT_235332 [Boletus coccyginus]
MAWCDINKHFSDPEAFRDCHSIFPSAQTADVSPDRSTGSPGQAGGSHRLMFVPLMIVARCAESVGPSPWYHYTCKTMCFRCLLNTRNTRRLQMQSPPPGGTLFVHPSGRTMITLSHRTCREPSRGRIRVEVYANTTERYDFIASWRLINSILARVSSKSACRLDSLYLHYFLHCSVGTCQKDIPWTLQQAELVAARDKRRYSIV